MKVLSIVIPAFNEESTIQKILDKIKNVELPQDWDKEIASYTGQFKLLG